MKYNVMFYDLVERKFKSLNVFRHVGFKRGVLELFEKHKNDKDKFLKELDLEAFYHFNCKVEFEIMVIPLLYTVKVGGEDGGEKKIDVYDQLRMNWDIFTEYTWKALREREGFDE